MKQINRVFWVALPLALAGLADASRAQSVLPAGFSESVVANGMSAPTAMEFAPDGRLFVALQGGRVRVIKNGAALSTDFLSLPVDSAGERGLIGLTFDPGFSSNRLLYVYYTVPSAVGSSAHNRVSSFRASATNPDVVEAGSERVLFELPSLSGATNHNGGAMHFGPDDKLYVAVGENANPPNSQSLGTVLGKMLRLNADGTPASGNPFGTASGQNQAIWAMGLRNPFTFAFDPAGGRMFINDVGQNTWEEINDGIAGSNYGWPNSEGATTNAGERTPLYSYLHGPDGANGQGYAITGGVFYRGSQFPSAYAGKYFYSDYVIGWIRLFDPATGTTSAFAAPRQNYSGVDLDVGPDGALYVLSYGQAAVLRISYSLAPGISSQPASQTVSAGSSVTFAVTASGNGPFSYQWQRNGTDIAGANQASYTLTAALSDNGAQFRCVVSNVGGQVISNVATLTVRASTAPVPVIALPDASLQYRAGQSIAFSGSASDAEDGTLPASALSWRVDFHHDTHLHPFFPETAGIASGSFSIPASGETSDNVWFRIHLTARDSSGLSTSTYRDIFPHKALISLATRPAGLALGLALTLDGAPVSSPLSVRGVTGIQREIGAPTQTVAGITYTFKSWSDGGSATHIISTPESDTSYTALFSDDRAPKISLDARFADGLALRSLDAISGAASDEGVGLERVAATLKRLGDGAFWNGSAWVAGASTYAASGTSSWSVGLPPLADGRYSFSATAFDVGGASTSTAAISFTIDTAAPVVAVTSPQDGAALKGVASASGTANDGAGSGLARVEASLQRLSDDGGASSDLSIPLSVAGLESWAAALPSLTDGRYRLRVTATDAAGNVAASSVEFHIDASAPPVAFSAALTDGALLNALPSLSGTVGSGAARVSIAIRRASDGLVWNGSAWVTSASLDAVLNASTWALGAALPGGASLLDGSYSITATAFDALGNSSSASVGIRIDRTAPGISIGSPRSGVILRAQPVVRGSASDANGVRTFLNLYRVATVGGRSQLQVFSPAGGWVAGVRFSPTVHDLPVAQTSGTRLSWSKALPPLASGRYQARAVAVDGAGNRSTSSLVAWTLDRDAPRVSLASPVANALLPALSLARGRASDVGTGVRGVSVVLLREGVGYWTGSGWSHAFSSANERPATITKSVVVNGAPSTVTEVEWAIRLPSLPPGRYQLRASVTDGAQQTGRTSLQAFTIASGRGS